MKTILQPGDSGMAERHARELAEQAGFNYVSPYNDPEIIAGQGTIGIELLDQLPDIDNIFISAVAVLYLGSVRFSKQQIRVQVFGVSATHSPHLLQASARARY